MKIRFISDNDRKTEEIKAIFKDQISLEMLPVAFKIHELQTDNEDLLISDKTLKAFARVFKPVFTEHTGLHIESINNFPKGLTSVFWNTLKNDLISEKFAGSPVTAYTIIGYCDGKSMVTFRGEIKGKIASKPGLENNFQWDPIFIPEGYDKPFSEISDIKQKISMRKIAFDKFIGYLNDKNK